LERKREQLQVKKERAILVGAIHRRRRGGGFKKHDNLVELTALVETAGAVVVDRFQQKIYRVNASTYIGSGKARMLCDRVERFDADVIIFNNDLSPGQIRELEEIIQTKVIDRSELILDIFATRAQTRQARLQIELAQLEYTYPRLTRMWSHLDRLAGGASSGGVGTRGTGEKQLEIDKRLVNKRISELKRELAGIDKRKLREIKGRGEMFKVSIVGYTNAGKSTLMNALTDADVFVEDRLFATLDTRTKKWEIEGSSKVLLSDTVGFVSNLPHQLVASFKATLEEAVNADLLVHVVDVSTSEAFDQIKSVESVLKEIGCEKKDVLVLLNKADVLSESATLESLQTIYPEAICISAKTGMNLDKVAVAVLEKYHGSDVSVRVVADVGNGKLLSFLHANGRIISTEYTDDRVVMEVGIGKSHLHMLKRLGPLRVQKIESRQ